ncbi:MAG: Rieske (2Fe-2S) protein [Chloroflexi bacterium]|nr:MAG: Rieske (2Fe-2S) protein [Chloroflexota bacterium]
MPEDMEERVNRVVEDLLRGRSPRIRARDAAEREAIMTAAILAAGQDAHPRMSPELRRRLAALVAGDEPRRVDRRTALAAVAGLAVGALGVVGLDRLGVKPGPSPALAPVPAGVVKAGPVRWVPVAALADLREGEPVRIVAGKVSAWLTRRGETVTAVSTLCSHWPCVLDFQAQASTLKCPCHTGASFALDGAPLSDAYPELKPLDKYAVRVENGIVMVLGT